VTRDAIVALTAESMVAAVCLVLAWASFPAPTGNVWLAIALFPLAFAALIVRGELRDRARTARRTPK
jgi:uncharacterized membrane protein